MANSEGRKEIYAEVLAESRDCQKALKHCKPAERFDLNISPDDANRSTVKVLRRSGELVGYLEPEALDKVAPKIAEGASIEAFALLVTDGELYNKRSRRIRLFRKPPLRCYVKIVA